MEIITLVLEEADKVDNVKSIIAIILMAIGFVLATTFIFLTINFRKNRVMKNFENDRSKIQSWKDFIKLNIYPFLAIMGIIILVVGIYLEITSHHH
ncbi:hypothetical protein [Spiroplasma endosymbiont of Crioceris asparagi]|uniref:hypothetical protein n=1 Tax=Spiroplasma endosymbiont of Crioceris asparagi TaxID=3066286 RepID=UPI0030D572D2